jgi:ABC-type taurine transport system ATPase subunit
MLALLGKTGCGKSTIFNMIAGLTEPTTGTVRVSGRDPFRDFDSFRGKMAIVFQSDRLLPWRTALQNVELGLEMLDVPAADRRAAAQLWLTKLGLGGHEHDYPHALSGGMRQRVSIAAHLRPTPISCSATNRSRRSMNPPPDGCVRSSFAWSRKTARPPSSSPIRSVKRLRSATVSWC